MRMVSRRRTNSTKPRVQTTNRHGSPAVVKGRPELKSFRIFKDQIRLITSKPQRARKLKVDWIKKKSLSRSFDLRHFISTFCRFGCAARQTIRKHRPPCAKHNITTNILHNACRLSMLFDVLFLNVWMVLKASSRVGQRPALFRPEEDNQSNSLAQQARYVENTTH